MNIFASYAEHDAERVGPILEGLESIGHEVWGDDTLAPGESFSSAIVRKLERADVVLVFLSEVATKSPWLPAELEHAL
ncbi:MAG: toll/interleukin-1 receptor domain-containing protein, partial [Deltaproteobacteria bacterium]|nr:toll/interleukin-1 receptor domain-containing protein [Deltaproteobacteria bacterium]